jgi:hypothetical protein
MICDGGLLDLQSRIVDQNIQTVRAFYHLRRRLFNGLEITQICDKWTKLVWTDGRIQFLYLLDSFLTFRVVSCSDVDCGTFGCHLKGRVEPDAIWRTEGAEVSRGFVRA